MSREPIFTFTPEEFCERIAASPYKEAPMARAMRMLRAVAEAAAEMGYRGAKLARVEVAHVYEPWNRGNEQRFEVHLIPKLGLKRKIGEHIAPLDPYLDALQLAHAILAKVPAATRARAIKTAAVKIEGDRCPMEWLAEVAKGGGK